MANARYPFLKRTTTELNIILLQSIDVLDIVSAGETVETISMKKEKKY